MIQNVYTVNRIKRRFLHTDIALKKIYKFN